MVQQIWPLALAHSVQSGANFAVMIFGWTCLSARDACRPMAGVVLSRAMSVRNHRALGQTVDAIDVRYCHGELHRFGLECFFLRASDMTTPQLQCTRPGASLCVGMGGKSTMSEAAYELTLCCLSGWLHISGFVSHLFDLLKVLA